jgi:hypothetical protein
MLGCTCCLCNRVLSFVQGVAGRLSAMSPHGEACCCSAALHCAAYTHCCAQMFAALPMLLLLIEAASL